MNIETNWDSIGVPGLNDEAYMGGHFGAYSGYVDPIFGMRGEMHNTENMPWTERAKHIGVASLSAVNPANLLRAGTTTAKFAGASAAKVSGAGRLAGKSGAKATTRMGDDAAKAAEAKYLDDLIQAGKVPAPPKGMAPSQGALTPQQRAVMESQSAAARSGAKSGRTRFAEATKHPGKTAARSWRAGAPKIGTRVAGRALQSFGGTTGVDWEDARKFIGGIFNPDMPNVDIDTGGFGGAPNQAGSAMGSSFGGAAAGAGAGRLASGYGNMGIDNKHGNMTGREAIWQGKEWGHKFGAPVATGEYMKIGERMLKEVKDKMYKDAKKGKKPAHGMVIVISSKAGPGPSKDGKREKLDSEKEE